MRLCSVMYFPSDREKSTWASSPFIKWGCQLCLSSSRVLCGWKGRSMGAWIPGWLKGGGTWLKGLRREGKECWSEGGTLFLSLCDKLVRSPELWPIRWMCEDCLSRLWFWGKIRKGHNFADTLLCHSSFAGISDFSHTDTSSLSVQVGMGRIHFLSNKFLPCDCKHSLNRERGCVSLFASTHTHKPQRISQMVSLEKIKSTKPSALLFWGSWTWLLVYWYKLNFTEFRQHMCAPV